MGVKEGEGGGFCAERVDIMEVRFRPGIGSIELRWGMPSTWDALSRRGACEAADRPPATGCKASWRQFEWVGSDGEADR